MHLVQVGAGMLLHYMSTLLEVGARLSGIRRRMDGGGGHFHEKCLCMSLRGNLVWGISAHNGDMGLAVLHIGDHGEVR